MICLTVEICEGALTLPGACHLRHAIELAEQARLRGDRPFGSVLVDKDGRVLTEGENTQTRPSATSPDTPRPTYSARAGRLV